MSYSFKVLAASKLAAKAAIAAELAQVAKSQASHGRDFLQAQAAANAFVDVLPDDDGQDVHVSVSGSLSGAWEGNNLQRVSGVNVCITASLAPREA